MRITIAEDAAILRDGLVQLLASKGHTVVAAVPTAVELIKSVDADRPDLVIADIRMPPTHTTEGLRAAIELRSRHPGLGVLVFSQYVETRYAADLLTDGAEGVGYLLKERVADVGEFLAALDRIAAGGTVLDPEVVTQLIGTTRRTDTLDALTARERQVLRLMAEGRANAAIANELHLSAGSIEKYVTSIFAKLDLAPSSDDHRRVLAVLRWLEA
ncbi:MAG TPA: response regulator transcription factor [Mycobacteriales bacterium]|jgi:DNA-binding NarL/FixJ family response regulator|nr:response regulator transcription factor [Mycobacteriales bacterium]